MQAKVIANLINKMSTTNTKVVAKVGSKSYAVEKVISAGSTVELELTEIKAEKKPKEEKKEDKS